MNGDWGIKQKKKNKKTRQIQQQLQEQATNGTNKQAKITIELRLCGSRKRHEI